jgi:uncharacterized protein YjbI with pentapeptide repeats
VADEEQVERLLPSVDEWNRWRATVRGRPRLRVADLSGADLSGANLSRANLNMAALGGAELSGANLSRANLRGANLSQANLSGADLSLADLCAADLSGALLMGADLSGADLSRANLSRADLSRADLNEANLSGTNLTGADLFKADLSGADLGAADLGAADLSGAIISETVFGATDLREARGLEECRHGGPSTLDFRTLQMSGMLPLPFLRGCGLPDTLIDYLPSLLNQAIEHYSCFISYSSKDDVFVNRLYNDLQGSGVRCWFAPHDLPWGEKTLPAVMDSIRTHDKTLLVLSRHSIASDWVEREVTTAMAEERKQKRTMLFPIRIDDAVLKAEGDWPGLLRESRNIGDFRRWRKPEEYESAKERLLKTLRREPALPAVEA